MAKVVLVWEMGTDLGHISRLDALAQHLCRRGHRVTCIFSDLSQIPRLHTHLKVPPYQILEGPKWQERKQKLSRLPASLTEVLLSVGFYKPQTITEKITQWRKLFADLEPDVILYDYAPTALLATRDLSCPKFNLGDPFSLPPARSPLPLFAHGVKVSEANLLISDRRLVDTINESLRAFSLNEIQYVYEIFSADKTFLLSIPELDPFSFIRNLEHYIGPFHVQQSDCHPLNWENDARKRIFGYLKPLYPQLKEILSAASGLDVQGRFFIPGAPQDLLNTYHNSNIEIVTTPYDLAELKQCDLVICHAGHSTLTQSILNGVPSLLIPLQQEQMCITQKAIFSQLAAGISHQLSDVDGLKTILKNLLNDMSFRHRVENCAEHYRQHLTKSVLDTLTEHIEHPP
jgi:UDP:flavonoid glycosyltransferase YjiC (YdhE family)